jgi:hypothetical protein
VPQAPEPPKGPSIDELLASGVLSPSMGPPEAGTGR